MQRILIVEDEPEIAIPLADDLLLEGYSVETVDDGPSAVRRGMDPSFHLILLDVMLPGKDGFEVCREIRRAGVRTPILFLTARSHESAMVLGFELGANDYITKPFSPRELRARIKARLRDSSPAALPAIAFADIVINEAAAEVRRAGWPVDLTPLEFRLLLALAKNRGNVLSRNQLIDLAWGQATYITDRAVDTHMVNLRRKIGPDHITSVRGFGYRLDA